MKYSNLEDLADQEIIDDLADQLQQKSLAENNLNQLLHFLLEETESTSKILYHGSPNRFNDFQQKPWKAFDGEIVLAPIWLTPDKNFAKINAGPSGWVYDVKTDLSKIFPKQELYTQKGNYVIPTKYGEKLLEDIVSQGMFGLGKDDWHEAEEILKSINRLDYDVIETGDFINWLKKNGYDSSLVRGDGPTNIAVLDQSNVKIVERQKISNRKP